jgi:hypothetical protein
MESAHQHFFSCALLVKLLKGHFMFVSLVVAANRIKVLEASNSTTVSEGRHQQNSHDQV